MKRISDKYKLYIFSAVVILATAMILLTGILGIQMTYTRQIKGILGMTKSPIFSQNEIDQIMSGEVTEEAVAAGEHLLQLAGYKESAAGLLGAQLTGSILFFIAAVILLAGLLLLGLNLQYRSNCRFYKNLASNIRYPDDPTTMHNLTKRGTAERRELLIALQEHQKMDARKELLMMQERKHIADWVEDIAHQLKTPLAVLSIQIDRMKRKQVVDEPHINKAHNQVVKMTKLINLLMTVGRLSTNAYHMDIQKHSVEVLMKRVTNEVLSICQEHEIELICTTEGNKVFFYDEDWMLEAISNLIKNGAEHSGNGSRIELHFLVLNTSMRITVRDYGCGIDPDKLSIIFERYISSHRQTDSSSGIGLSIAKQITEEHFGNITAQNQPEGGVLFTISIPLLQGGAVYEQETPR